MRYLKSYDYYKPEVKVNESIETNIKSDIEDIALEFTDCEIDYQLSDCSYYKNGVDGEESFRILIRDIKNRFFRLDNIEDVILRLKDYLQPTDYSIDIAVGEDYIPLSRFLTDFSGEELYHIYIYVYYNPLLSSGRRKYDNNVDEEIYESVESSGISDIISDIKDMLVEIKDIGGIETNCREFNIFNYKTKTDDSEIRVWIRPIESDYDEYVDDNFEIDDTVIEVFRRIIDYMKSTGYSEYGVVHDDGVQVLPMNLDNIDRQRQRGLMSLSEQETFGIWFRLPKEINVSDKDIPKGWVKANNKLVKDFKFETFREAQKFVNKVADISESQNHHPKIEWVYNRVKLTLSTHDSGDIFTKKDIRLALSINEI